MCKKTFGLFHLLIIILTLSLLVSCKNANKDSENNGQQNTPDDGILDTSLYLPITEDGEGCITVVSSYSKAPVFADAFGELMDHFADAGIKLAMRYEVSDDESLPELIIGDRVNASGDTYVDPHLLGDEGYAIRVVGNKIIVAGGTYETLAEAIGILSDSILCLDDPDTDTNNLYIPRDTDIFIRQYYPITSITVGDRDLAGYTIVCDTDDKLLKATADKLQDVLYDRAGYWLGIRKSAQTPAIRISMADYAGESGFRVYVDGEDILVECAYRSLFEYAFDSFINSVLAPSPERNVNMEGEIYSLKISTVSYSDFGAVGDGITDDYEAIKAAHDEANRTGQMVVAEEGKTYYLGQHQTPISIKTDVDWTGATFIIDDSDILPTSSLRTAAVFHVQTDSYATPVVGIDSLSKGQANVGKTFDTSMLLYIVYGGNKQYIRYGANADSGADQQEIILVDKDGNVDPSTPILWDYPMLSSVAAYPVDDRPITITGGTFVTIANQAPREYTYYSRNIYIKRSNVTIDGLTHLIEGEGDTGAPYSGFISISYCTNVTVKNTVLTGHKVYKLSTDQNNSMGTYDISLSLSNNVTFLNSGQTNDITDTTYWGIMGSNYCKNITYDGCVFSRFDAHKGTYNATIKNSEIGHQKLSVIGQGTLYVENTVFHGNTVVALRTDYGSTWEGDVILKNITLKNTSNNPTLISGNWYNHYFGYTCFLPENIIVDGITLAKGTSFRILPNLKNDIDKDTVLGENNLNPIVLTKKITVLNNSNGYSYSVSANMTLFKDVELIGD